MKKIKFTKNFKYNLHVIINNLYYFSSNGIDNLTELLNIKLQYLQMFPKMYPKLLIKPELRKIPIKKYIILYKIKENEIILTHIIHQKSKYLNNQD